MRKRKWKQGIAVLTAAALVLTGITVPGSAGAKAKIRLNKKKVTIKVGGKVTLKLKNAKKKVIWKSSKKKVASVSAKGIVRGKSAGTAKITAKSNKKSYTCTVIVKEKRDSFVEPDETEMPGTTVPTAKPTGEPTKTPVNPTSNPTKAPASEAPVNPTKAPVNPTKEPTTAPTAAPSGNTLTIGKYSHFRMRRIFWGANVWMKAFHHRDTLRIYTIRAMITPVSWNFRSRMESSSSYPRSRRILTTETSLQPATALLH